MTVLARRVEAELGAEGVQERRGRPLPDAHRPVPLDVRVPAHRAHPGAGAADVAAHQQDVDDLLDRRDGARVLGQAHRPAHDDPLGGEHPPGQLVDLRRRQAGDGGDLVVAEMGPHVLGERVETGAVRVDEVVVEDGAGGRVLRVEQPAGQPLEQRKVTAEADLQELVGERGAAPEQAAGVLRVTEPQQRRLGQRVDRDDTAAGALDPFQRAEHPRMVRAGVLPDDEHQVGGLQVGEGHRALADPDRRRQRRAGGLVAQVRAVRQVVRAEHADEQLVDERRLVAGAPRGVERGLLRARERGQLRGDEPERLVPADRGVVRGARRPVHRFDDAPLTAQPVPGAPGEVGQRMLGEKCRRHARPGGLLGDRLRPVLAELGDRALPRRLGPGTARAVEPVVLVDQAQCAQRPPRPHPLERLGHRVPDPGQPRRRPGRRPDPRIGVVRSLVVPISSAAHALHHPRDRHRRPPSSLGSVHRMVPCTPRSGRRHHPGAGAPRLGRGAGDVGGGLLGVTLPTSPGWTPRRPVGAYANLTPAQQPAVWRDFGVIVARSTANRPWMPALGNPSPHPPPTSESS
ncbi:hypothetical protein FAGKG844_130072 [Frankia sp. AgKG'84/4]